MINIFQIANEKTLKKLITVVLLFSISVAYSQNTNYENSIYKTWQEFSSTDINSSYNGGVPVDLAPVFDSEINVPNHVSIHPKAYAKLRVLNDVPVFDWVKTRVKLELQYYLPDGTIDVSSTTSVILEVEYNPNTGAANFIDIAEHIVANQYGLKASVLDLTTEFVGGVTTHIANPNIVLELGFECERYYQLSQQLPTIQSQIFSDNDEMGNSVPSVLSLRWDTIQGATEYELEWTWVDNYGTPNSNGNITTMSPDLINFSSRDFEINCTRIKTNKPGYEIPLIYSHGYIIYRVRAVGRFLDEVSKNLYGPWSSGTSIKTVVDEWNDKIEVTDHEIEKNWQFQSSYAEEGKKKEVVSYFDGTLRNRQTVTKTNTNNTAIVGEVIYDNQGRPAVEVLPVPLRKQNYIRYFRDVNRNTDGASYSHYDFDWDFKKECSINLLGMTPDYGSSRYYSKSNDFYEINTDFIPDAFNYPFSQVEYTPDNTGRIRRKGGVGQAHQLESGHEMKYFYTTPYQEELNRLFGYSVGYVSHYKKNIVVDPNGQVSVSYIDPQGRTIATALSGGSPTNLLSLQEEKEGIHEGKTVDLMNNTNPEHHDTPTDNNILSSTGVFQNMNDKLTLSREVVVAGNNVPYNFNYVIQNSSTFIPQKCNTKYPFVYDLKLSLKDECTNELFQPYNAASGPEYNRLIGNTNISTGASVITPTTVEFTNLLLNTGSHTLLKELKINEQALNSFADDYISRLTKLNGECYIPQNVFSSTSVSSNCSTSCSECISSIGKQDEYVLSQLKSHYHNDTFSNLNLGTTNSVSFQNMTTDYNENENIDYTEVVALINIYKNEWQDLKNGCNQFCGPTFSSSCSVDESSLLVDVSPKGQYGDDTIVNLNTTVGGAEIFGVSNVLSIFNDTNSQVYYNNINNLASSDAIQNDWRHPITPYQDDLGVPSRIEVVLDENTTDPTDYSPRILSSVNPVPSQINGQTVLTVLPQELASVEDFITTYWIPNWAQSLLPYHPEFCYLQYSRELCSKTKPTDVLDNPTVTTSTSRPLSTDEYDGYLEYINTYAAAVNAGFVSSATGIIDPTAIYYKDPYFASQLSNSFETLGTFNSRTGIMLEAINTNYDGLVITMLLQAYRNVVCNSITACNQSTINISSFSDAQKDRFWNTYKNLYKSLKTKIKYIFINVYAKEHGCYNGCIGTDAPSTITNVINTYSQAAGIYDYFYNSSFDSNQLCSTATAVNYQTKQKRFIPSDFAYNSGISPSAAVAELTAQAQYQQYAQTGNCPLLMDLENYLDDYFKVIPSSGLNNASQPVTQGLTLALFKGFTGANINVSNPPPITNANTTTVLDGTNKTITFSLSGSGFTPASSSVPQLSITIPNTAGYPNWSNFGTSWTISDFKQFYYDKNASNLTNLNALDFAFSTVIVYLDNTGVKKEMIVTGHTRAAIGECGTENVIGQVLDNNTSSSLSSGCDTKYKFKEAIVKLLNQLKGSNNALYSTTPVPLSTYTSYTQSYLKDFFGETATIVGTWKYASGTFSITKGSQTVFTMQVPTLPTSGINHFEGIAIGTPVTSFTLFYNLTNNPTTLQNVTGNFNSTISFSCCDAQTNIVPNFSLRRLISYHPTNVAGYVYYSDRNFIPLNISIPLNQDFVFEFSLKSSSTRFSYDRIRTLSDFDSVDLKINNISYPISFSSKNNDGSIPSNTRHQDPLNVLSWHTFYGATFDIDYLNYKINSNDNVEFKFDEFVGNPMSTNGISMYCTPTPLWNSNYGLSLNNPIESTWTDSHPINFDQFFEINFKAKLKVTDQLPYYNNILGSSSYYYGTFAQLDYVNPNDSNIMYQLLFAATNQTSDLCTTCIPQTIAPISCNDKYTDFLNFMGLRGGTPRFSGITSVSDTYTLEEFCNNNLGYLVDSYQQFITLLGITSTEDPRYLTLIQFGDTDLHYGYKDINTVITAYNNYLITFANTTPSTTNTDETVQAPYSWKDFVNLSYIPNSPTRICPPAAMPVVSLTITESQTPCQEMSTSVTDTYLDDTYNAYIRSLREDFIKQYIAAAMLTVSEQFTMTYFDKEYQYTLYYYDQAGNLIQTVAPKGVKRFEDNTINTGINNFRNTTDVATSYTGDDSNLLPPHSFKTQYKYNSLNQLVWQSTPDGGITKFAYDALGRIIASQNDNQSQENNKMSYTVYDVLGRITEAGEIVYEQGLYSINNEGKLIKNGAIVNLFDAYGSKTQVTKTIYDDDPLVESSPTPTYASSLFISNSAGNNPVFNNRNRVTGIFYYKNIGDHFLNAIFYNYDVHGNVKELINYYPYLRGANCDIVIDATTGQINDCEAHIKRVLYDYDLISGNVKQVTYQPNKPNQGIKKDMFIHKYEYDADNRIVNVQTSRDGVIWEKDANYYYYPHGPLSRTAIGDKNVQGVDYAYTLQGWLKMVNGENISNPKFDMMRDGLKNNFNKDVFGYSLNYFDAVQNEEAGNVVTQGDYKAIRNDNGSNGFPQLMYSRNPSIQSGSRNLFNGNIKKMTTAMRVKEEDLLPTQVNKYGYDQLNRIKNMSSSSINGDGEVQDSYAAKYEYDKNGNLLNLFRSKRNLSGGSPISMDELRYDYNNTDNKLHIVHDEITDSSVDNNDLEDQVHELASFGIIYDPNNPNTDNYVYDKIGQLVLDRSEQIKIGWRVDGKVNNIDNNKTNTRISFQYDGLGNRIAKTVVKDNKAQTTYYSRDAQGNVLAVYTINPNENGFITERVNESHIYGSSRLGIEGKNDLICKISNKVSLIAGNFNMNLIDSNNDGILNYLDVIDNKPESEQAVALSDYYNVVGDKSYELSNHLGNVLEVINDKKIPSLDNNGQLLYFNSDILSYSDYYPFGSLLPDRHGSNEHYRYGFQGQEKDDELKGEGNSLNYEYRMHDPRVGRFFAVDPLTAKYPFYSPYQFSGNRLIDMVELEGLEPAEAPTSEGQRADAIDQNAVKSNDYGPSDFIGWCFGSTENNKLYKTWVSYAVTGTNSYDWVEEANYKQMIMPIAVDLAQSKGWSFGTSWQSAKDNICNPNEANNLVSQETMDFISSRILDSGCLDYLTQIGEHEINSYNKAMYGSATGAITPMELDDPFIGVIFGLRGVMIRNESTVATESAYVNLASESRTTHILAGDATGGGHSWFGSFYSFSNGLKGSKSMFPLTWSNEKIMHAVSDVIVNNQWIQQTGKAGALLTRSGAPVRYMVDGVYEGTKIRAIITRNEVITAFPIK